MHAAELARCLELNPGALRVLAAQGHPIAAGVLKTFEVALANVIYGDCAKYEAGYQKRKARRQRARARRATAGLDGD